MYLKHPLIIDFTLSVREFNRHIHKIANLKDGAVNASLLYSTSFLKYEKLVTFEARMEVYKEQKK